MRGTARFARAGDRWRVCRLRSRLRGRAGYACRVLDVAPAHPDDFPDPFVLAGGGTYYAYATNGNGSNVQVMTSPDLRTWRREGDGLPHLPPWAAPGFTWSPAVLQRDGAYVLYYVARHRASGRQAISVAISHQPGGPFADVTGEPLVFQLERGGSIDPSPFVDVDGAAYLLWKSDENALDRPSCLWGQPLTADGRALAGHAHLLLRHAKAWERPLIEAPSMVCHGGLYYLFYSANWWESAHYCIGLAVGRSPLGPFSRVTTSRPLFAVSGLAGAGGQEFFRDRDGGLHMAFHAWTPGAVGYANAGRRSLCVARVELVDGLPSVTRGGGTFH